MRPLLELVVLVTLIILVVGLIAVLMASLEVEWLLLEVLLL